MKIVSSLKNRTERKPNHATKVVVALRRGHDTIVPKEEPFVVAFRGTGMAAHELTIT